ncbi:MAG TPA: nitroreductase [Coriobacteriia bacterium]
MELSEAIRERRSVRAFLPDDVPAEVVEAILEEARWAPSWANAQDWDVFALTGPRLERFKSVLAEKLASDAESVTDIRFPGRGEWPEHIRERMTYRRPTPGAEAAPPQRPGLATLYGAPWALLFAIHEDLAPEYACFDTGLLVQNVCLEAHDRGLGTCIMAMAVRFADSLHDVVPEAAGRRFVVAVTLGHPDPDSPVNAAERERVPLSEVATFLS